MLSIFFLKFIKEKTAVKTSILLLIVVFCQSCSKTFTPNISQIDIPLEWKEKTKLSDRANSIIPEKFWEIFGDPNLNHLEELGIKYNLDLEAALYRIQASRALTTIENSKRFPQINLSAAVTKDETLIDPGDYGVRNPKFKRVQQSQYNILTQLSYEVDLWGKLKDIKNSFEFKEQASVWEHQFIYQTLVTDIALSYFAIRTFESEIRFFQKIIDIQEKKIEIYQSRIDAGVDSELEISRSKLELGNIQVELENAKKNYGLEKNRLAILIGSSPSSFEIAPGFLPDKAPSIPNVLPSETLTRRADVQRSLSLLAASHSEVNAALKNYFPSFSLVGALGLASPTISSLFDWEGRYWKYLLSILEPIFDGRKRAGLIKRSKAVFYENFSDYKKSIIQALRDVEDSLAESQAIDKQIVAQKMSLEAAHNVLVLTEDQFLAGLITYLLVADAEHSQIEIERKILLLKGSQFRAWIKLIKALGIEKSSKDKDYPCTFSAMQEKGSFENTELRQVK